MPQPSKFTAEVQRLLLEARKVGASQETCANHARIDGATLSRYLARGKEADEGTRFRNFYLEWMETTAHPTLRALALIYDDLPDNPPMAWKFVERKEPGFAPPIAAPHPVLGPVVINLGLASPRELEALPDPNVIEGEIVEEA